MTVFARGPLPVSVPGGPPNVGQILINPSLMGNLGFEWINLVKTLNFPWNNDAGHMITPDIMDGNGYPTAFGTGGTKATTSAVFPSSTEVGDMRYFARWTSSKVSTQSINVPGVTMNGGTNFSSVIGRNFADFTFNQDPYGSQTIEITDTGVSDLAIYHHLEDANFQAGKLAGSKFTSRIKAAQTPTLRNINWLGVIDAGASWGSVVNWADRTPIGHVSYFGDHFNSAYWASGGGATTSGAISGTNYNLNLVPNNTSAPGGPGVNVKQTVHCFFNVESAPAWIDQDDQQPSLVGGNGGVLGNTITLTTGTVLVGQTINGTGTNGVYVTATSGPAGAFVCTLNTNVNVPNGTALSSPQLSYNTSTNTVNWTGHPLSNGDILLLDDDQRGFSSSLFIGQNYYVINSTTNTFQLALTSGGSAVTISTTGIGNMLSRAPTLKLTASGTDHPRPIRDFHGHTISGFRGNFLTAGTDRASVWTCVYHGGLDCWFAYQGGLTSGVSVEAFQQLCAEVGCHPWFCSPPLACDPMTDWHFQLATYCKNNCPSWQIPMFEITNEPWNDTIARMESYPWFVAEGSTGSNWQPADELNWVSKICATAGQDISAVLGPPDRTKYWIIYPAQGNQGGVNDVMNSPQYLGQSTSLNQLPTSWNPSGYNNTNPAHYYLTHVDTDMYLDLIGEHFNRIQTNSWIANQGNSTAQQAAVDAYLDEPNYGFPAALLFNFHFTYSLFGPSWVAGFTNHAGKPIQFCSYEGGFVADNGDSFDPTFTGSTSVTTLTVTAISTDVGIAAGMTLFGGVSSGTTVVGPQLATFTGRIDNGTPGTPGLVLTVSSPSGAPIVQGMVVSDAGGNIAGSNNGLSGVIVGTQISGTVGGAGTYNTSNDLGINMLVASETMTGNPNGGIGQYTITPSQTVGSQTMSAHCTAFIASTPGGASSFTLNVASISSGALFAGQPVSIFPGGTLATITAGPAGGGVGAYTLDTSIAVAASTQMISSPGAHQNAAFQAALKQGTNTQSYYTQNVNKFKSAGGVQPCCFQLSGTPVGPPYTTLVQQGNPDAWSVLDDIYQADTPQWKAIVSFNHP